MNRTTLTLAGLFSASSRLLVDSAVKGTALLVLAAIVVKILRRDSAATRHLVWMLAIVAMLVMPVLAATLPQWRVLPECVSTSPKPLVVESSPPSIARPARSAIELPRNVEPADVERPYATAHQPAAGLLDSRPGVVAPGMVPEAAVANWNWMVALPLVWAVGFSVLILRLMAARWMLWSFERQGAVIWSTRRAARTPHDPILSALEAVSSQLGISRPVTLLIHMDKSIPVVWGILRYRLLLPAAAQHWSGEQLRSVLLHELAHIKRRDTMSQILVQMACALHWFNPLVWFAAWRLGVERERACDDLVLASGVRPSAYAGHLLDVVTGHAPARWTSSCGLAIARKSSLEGRLVAVLSENRNRRGMSLALSAIALGIAVGIAVPLAMLRAAQPVKPKADATTVNDEPKDANSRPLFENWKSGARSDGKIPGGRIGEMAASLKTYMDLNAGTEAAIKCEAAFKKCDAAHDWTPAEAVALLDEIEVVAPSRAEWAMRAITEREIHSGKPLPDELADAPWGAPAANGLRIAWLLEPRTETHALDSVMKSRVLFHNTGKVPVCFATEDWIQVGTHRAKDANGKDISVWAVMRLGIRLRMNFRLAPGQYAEVEGHGLGVGSHQTSTEKSIYKVGCWIEAKEGDAVSFTPGSVPVSFQTWKDNEGLKDSITVWREMIAARVMREGPMPAGAADREQLLRRVMRDFPGTAPTPEEIAAFTADNPTDALAKLISRLQTRVAAMHFAGELSGGETKFRVTKEDRKKDEPKTGAQLKPATEQKLKWGEPVNGLRMALAWPPTLGEPVAGEVPDLFLAVQNVSEAAVRLCTTSEAPNQRRLTFATNGVLQGRTVSSEPNGTDATLRPREVLFLRLLTEGAKNTERASRGSMFASTVRQSPGFTLQADLEIAKAPAGAWTGKLVTPTTRAGIGVEAPKNRKAQELFKVWLAHARVNGKIPGGCIARLADRVKEFVRGNLADPAGEPYAKRMEPLVSRLDGTRDWQLAEASALLTDIAAVSDSPLSVMLEETAGGTILYSPSLNKELENAPWGEALPNGLRVACLLEPRAAAHRLGTPLKMRIVVHNAGKETVVFRSRTWHHIEPTARDAKGAEIEMESATRFNRPPLVAYRVVPGGCVELASPGIGVGKRGFYDFHAADIASWISAKGGDEVTLIPGPVPLGDWNEAAVLNGEPRWWRDFLAARLSLATPLPADAAERAALLESVVSELFYASPTAEETAAFLADHEPTALDSLAKRLAHRAGVIPFAGSLTSGPTKFRVLPADHDAAKNSRPASNPGR